ncbi:MAG: hypothetical protein MJ245_03315 [Clostridia bacterium]|nr:hypothetical protein [Clostridia bacterium]
MMDVGDKVFIIKKNLFTDLKENGCLSTGVIVHQFIKNELVSFEVKEDGTGDTYIDDPTKFLAKNRVEFFTKNELMFKIEYEKQGLLDKLASLEKLSKDLEEEES